MASAPENFSTFSSNFLQSSHASSRVSFKTAVFFLSRAILHWLSLLFLWGISSLSNPIGKESKRPFSIRNVKCAHHYTGLWLSHFLLLLSLWLSKNIFLYMPCHASESSYHLDGWQLPLIAFAFNKQWPFENQGWEEAVFCSTSSSSSF